MTALKKLKKVSPVIFFLVLCVLLLVLSYSQTPVQANRGDQLPSSQTKVADDEACLGCHSRPGQLLKLPSGEQTGISIDKDLFVKSAHGAAGKGCTDCHKNITGYPHPEQKAQDLRDYSAQYKETCKDCHSDQYAKFTDSVHRKYYESGNQNAPLCSDCHNPHTQQKLEKKGVLNVEERKMAAQVCAKCHNAIYTEYKDSVHGAALITENNGDVPVCTSCHGIHNIVDPTTPQQRVDSIQMCANCHTDEKMMKKYNLNTHVLDTYVSDFHGTTATLFKKQSPNERINAPVCYDCHGVHNILKTNDPKAGLQNKENLLKTCQKCHPDAASNFSNVWLGHYYPSLEKYPLVYIINLFYWILIPLVIGSMLIFVISDFIRRRINANKGAR